MFGIPILTIASYAPLFHTMSSDFYRSVYHIQISINHLFLWDGDLKNNIYFYGSRTTQRHNNEKIWFGVAETHATHESCLYTHLSLFFVLCCGAKKRSDQTPQVGTIFDSKPCHLRAPLFERFIILVIIGQILVAQKRTLFYVYIYIIYIHNVRRLAYVNIYIERIMYIYNCSLLYIYNNCTYMCIYINIYIYTKHKITFQIPPVIQHGKLKNPI